ncbi:MAG: hypothetical protein ACYS8I_00290 [Planctomycetota bacterium]|jgi:hypothetical protein
MKNIAAMMLLFGCALPVIVSAGDCNTTESPLIELLNQYSETHGTKFVVDPRARAKVTLIGIEPAALDTGTLIGVLNIHGFTALTTGGVVYVMPYKVAEVSGDKYGRLWEG